MSADATLAPTRRRYSKAQKDQAIRLVRQIREETGERHGAVQRVARQLGDGVATVRKWVNQTDVDAGERPGMTTEDNAKIRACAVRAWRSELQVGGHRLPGVHRRHGVRHSDGAG